LMLAISVQSGDAKIASTKHILSLSGKQNLLTNNEEESAVSARLNFTSRMY